jgi:hypothetical protein
MRRRKAFPSRDSRRRIERLSFSEIEYGTSIPFPAPNVDAFHMPGTPAVPEQGTPTVDTSAGPTSDVEQVPQT